MLALSPDLPAKPFGLTLSLQLIFGMTGAVGLVLASGHAGLPLALPLSCVSALVYGCAFAVCWLRGEPLCTVGPKFLWPSCSTTLIVNPRRMPSCVFPAFPPFLLHWANALPSQLCCGLLTCHHSRPSGPLGLQLSLSCSSPCIVAGLLLLAFTCHQSRLFGPLGLHFQVGRYA